MGTAERRNEIMRILCRRRHEIVSNLATEFGVSERTIRRDIEALSATEPIYTQCGRYGGGVYVLDNYRKERMYMNSNELKVLHKLFELAQKQAICILSRDEKHTLRLIIDQYTKPIVRKRETYEKTRKKVI